MKKSIDEIRKDVSEKFETELSSFRKILGNKEAGLLEKSIKKDIIEVLITEPIQFLHERFQLGLLHLVSSEWGNVKHTRFDHTVGVVAKCIIACDIINLNTQNERKESKNDLDRKITERDARELAVAAALHDCGHFPISHATERAFLTAKGFSTGIKHEERIVPLIVTNNPLFEDLRNIVLNWEGFTEKSFYRIASIISVDMGNEFVRTIEGFVLPKRALQQLLVSEIDMDRLDYVLRDSQEIKYSPVTMIHHKIVKYVNGLSLEKSKIIGGGSPKYNAELSLLKEDAECNYLESAFYLLVSRVMLYKYIYFSEKLRSFEAILTYLVGTLLQYNVAVEPLKLIAMPDNSFIDEYLEGLVDYIDENESTKIHLKEKYINVLKNEKVQRFKLLFSIKEESIDYPSIKNEFKLNINKRSYINNLRNYIDESVKSQTEHTDHPIIMQRSDILLDVFHLKTGGGDLIVKSKEKISDKKKKAVYKSLKDYMNGSNMHRLCSETRLDVYMKSDLNDRKKEIVKDRLKSFFKYKQDEL